MEFLLNIIFKEIFIITFVHTDYPSVREFDRQKRKRYQNKKKTQCRFCIHFPCTFASKCWSLYLLVEFIYYRIQWFSTRNKPCYFLERVYFICNVSFVYLTMRNYFYDVERHYLCAVFFVFGNVDNTFYVSSSFDSKGKFCI